MNQTELDTVRERVEKIHSELLWCKKQVGLLEDKIFEAKRPIVGTRVSFKWAMGDKFLTGTIAPTMTSDLNVFVTVKEGHIVRSFTGPIDRLKVVEEVQDGD